MIGFALWGLILFAQNASFTLVSRARNSGSIGYHALASVASNGIWILSMYFVVDKLHDAKGDWARMLEVGLFYTAFTVAGATFMHWFSMTYLEKGKRKVGG
jgi:hypothetical protein